MSLAATPAAHAAAVDEDGWLPLRLWVPVAVGTSLVIFALATAAVYYRPPGSLVAAWWPAAGVLVALMIRTRPGLRWTVAAVFFVASLVANLLSDRTLFVAAGFSVANLAEALVAAWWLTRGRRGAPWLASLEDLWRLIVAAFLGALTAALLAGLTAVLSDLGPFVATSRAVFASHSASLLIIVPLAMRAPRRVDPVPVAEVALQWGVLLTTLLLVFRPSQSLPIAFLPMPVLMWGAMRLGPRMASAQLLVAGVVTSVLTTTGNGPFVEAVQQQDLAPVLIGTLLQACLLAYALVTLPIALTAAQRAAVLEEATSVGEQLNSVLDATTGIAIIGVERDGSVAFFNPGAERMLGWTADEVVGRRTPMLWHREADVVARAAELGVEPGFPVFTAAVDRGAEAEVRDWVYVRKDGSELTVSLRVAKRYDGRGRHVGYLGVAEDVTERRRTEEMMRVALQRERDAVERLAALDQVKTDFVSSVSHELRTPITSILGYTELILAGAAGELDPRQHSLLERVDRNTRRLLGLIEDLLTLSQIEAGTFRMRVSRLDLRDVVAGSLDALETQLAASTNHVEVAVPPEPVSLEGDPDQLERVLINLLSNALKFTPAGGRIDVRIGVEGTDALLEVSDTGVGIPLEEQPRMFERFFRASTSQADAIPGTGLGLAIVDKIVTSHCGSVQVQSEPGRGTRFTVRIPRELRLPCPEGVQRSDTPSPVGRPEGGSPDGDGQALRASTADTVALSSPGLNGLTT